MEQPHKDFEDIVIKLAREDEQKDDNSKYEVTLSNHCQKSHLFSVIAVLALYLIPAGRWDDLESSLETMVNGAQEGTAVLENVKILKVVLSQYDFKAKRLEYENAIKEMQSLYALRIERLDMFIKILESSGGELTYDQYREQIPSLLSILEHLDGMTEGKYIEKIVGSLSEIYMSENPTPTPATAWIDKLMPTIIDTLIKVLDRNQRKKGFADKKTKGMVYGFLLDVAENDNDTQILFTDSHLERMVALLYEWLAQVDDEKEWTDGYDPGVVRDKVNLNINEEQESDLYKDQFTYLEGKPVEADASFLRFVASFLDRVQEPVFKHFNSMLNSHWKQRYAALVSLSKFCSFFSDRVVQQFPFILKTILKSVEDKNIQVRWASLQCLVRLPNYQKLMIVSREKIIDVIDKLIGEPNERIQVSCCLLVQSMTDSLLEKDMINETTLFGLCRSFETLLQSQNIHYIESALSSLMSVIYIFNKRLRPYFGNIGSILLSMLERYQSLATMESRLLRCRAIKAIALCHQVMDKKTYSKYMHEFMMVVKKNERSFDLTVDVVRVSRMLISTIGLLFAEYLPIIIGMVVRVLETPLPNQQQQQQQQQQLEMTESLPQDVRGIVLVLKSLHIITEDCQSPQTHYNDNISQMLAPFVDVLVDPICKLARNPFNNIIQLFSYSTLPGLVKMVMRHYGADSDKTIEMVGKVYELVLWSCPLEIDWKVLNKRISVAISLIGLMSDEMSVYHIQSTIDIFLNINVRMDQILQKVRNDNQEVTIGEHQEDIPVLIANVVSNNYEMLAEMVRDTWAFIKRSIQSNWNTIPSQTRKQLSTIL
ncbi:hypothetical protein DFA_01880 [Cavenderia fasciculata]|uniref:Uncharacterized protein n=1 Tax=Cavenderia fasciculata TaxID=261658 RepID=F4PV85_CACFS|nr:uncharacterized protein DFA_01880 [Cavenderia fasciculata]EGG21993.1 hypothetical protein DFA_01880 [Cavenderia fasciculata]|eukprot:XP_004359844.1 hypothetical protein DFA_01880 [Cavenderia fasciculata]